MLDVDVRVLTASAAPTRHGFLADVFGNQAGMTWQARAMLAQTYFRLRAGFSLRPPTPRDVRRAERAIEATEPNVAASLKAGGYNPVLIGGTCLGAEWPEKAVGFTRRASIRAGDAVAFVADGIPAGMCKIFVGWRMDADAPGGGFLQQPEHRVYLFYQRAPRFIMAVPGGMLRHIERVEFLKVEGCALAGVKPDAEAAALAQGLDIRTFAAVGDLPHAGGHLDALAGALEAIRAKARALP